MVKDYLPKKDFIRLDYVDKDGLDIDYKNGVIYGFFRTAGVLAIMLAHVMKSKNIYVAGMDGFTLYSRKEIEKGKQNQHVYGKGFTDNASWEDCVKKDEMVDEALHNLAGFGVRFEIITPTKFKDFYNSNVLI